jgi:1-acyl-sn-glycerol-3-phosphate acyltransferase
MIRATLMYLFVGTYVLLSAPVGLIWIILTGDAALIFKLSRFCIRMTGWIFGIRVVVEGKGKIDPKKTYVFLSNHQGNFDGPVLLHVIGRDLRALIKREMMRLPVLSLVFKRIQYIPIERLNPKQAHSGIELGAKLLLEGKSFFAFPEGTRSRDGQLGAFKKGVFIMAIKAQIPIVPITILNSRDIQPPGKYGIRPGCIRLVIHDPIETEGMTVEERNLLIQRTREAITSALLC